MSQLVAGIQSDKVRDRLLREGSELTLEKSIDICRSNKVTQQQMKLFHGECEVNSLNKRQAEQNNKNHKRALSSDGKWKGKQRQAGNTEKGNSEECRNCGRRHEVRNCPAYGKECFKCQKKNHFAKMCRTDLKQSRELHKRVKEIRADTNDDFVIDTVSILENCVSKGTEALAVVNILDERVRVKLDTAAEVNVMPSRVYQKLVFNKKISRDAKIKGTNTKLTGYGGAEIPVKGTCRLPCSFKENALETEFYIVETDNKTVLGLETCNRLSLIRVMHSVMSNSKANDCPEEIPKESGIVSGCSEEQIKENYKEVFQGLGKLEESYNMQIDSQAVP